MSDNHVPIPAIHLENLTQHYGKLTAVDDLSLSIRKGEIYGLLGLNGAGKTTTIRMLLGMIRPDAGTVELFGTPVRPGLRSIWNRVGYMIETPHAYPELTVRENLEIMRRLHQIDDPAAVDEVIELLNLEREAGKQSGKLSLGNRQRLGLAKAFLHHPDLLILDEPANGLDPAGIVEIRNLLRDLVVNRGVTIFMSSHILSEVARLATRIGVVHQGKLVQELKAGELEARQQSRIAVTVNNSEVALDTLKKAGVTAVLNANDAIVITDRISLEHPERIAKLLVEADCPPSRLVSEREDLESYFLELVGR